MAALPPNGAIKPTGLVPMESKNQDLINRVKQYENIPWCEQYERMISGMLYDSTVEILEVARLRSRKIQKKYIDHLPDDATPTSLGKEREEILRSHVGQLGKGCWIEAPYYFDYGCNISIGDRFYANTNLTILDCGLVTIGHRVMFGPFVSIYAATHETEVASRRDNIEFAREVSIGDDCWIGGSVVILPGVSIGEGCTVAAGSVVTKSVEPWSVVMGMPARVVKKVTPVPPIES
ncbi:Trimeric LpxA-like enzyme [Glarea lozoyensis ATCC 20868]|uniref:Trimeric LpxA-like enzyme n=1 Tax=Glarea lozoyensis (strain ATCC 20868 / MF5171) TaxID=1116229 RepID=S3CZ05_GLAL2|nr:Trimeric LpxA-like enzyme [Glarea lozoyensis ATCC 20868]EPE30164.1 Trimeric LpxA-like enzyme [Glarea lozoyensis ATCC 20868]